VRVDEGVYSSSDGLVDHNGVSVTHPHQLCLNSDSQHQLSDKHVVPCALVHRAFCDWESIRDQLESIKLPLKDHAEGSIT
jgi:hypothetical protein